MEKLTIEEMTTSAHGGCAVCSRSLAHKFFLQLGARGETNLCQVKDESGKSHVLWINTDGKSFDFLPLFISDMDLPGLKHVEISSINEITMIYRECNNKAGVCYMVIPNENDLIVRQLRIMGRQSLVEHYCKIQGVTPTDICLVKVCTIQENRYITTCWLVSYTHPNELDCDGEPQEYETLLPVDMADADILEEISITSIYREELPENGIFKTQGQIYRVMRDDRGKLFITKDLFTPKSANQNGNEALSKNENTGAEKPACRHIPLNQH